MNEMKQSVWMEMAQNVWLLETVGEHQLFITEERVSRYASNDGGLTEHNDVGAKPDDHPLG